MKVIEIFGTGCENCQRLELKVRSAVKKLGIEADIKKIEDFETIIRRDVTKTPGLAIDGRIVSLGRVPSVEEIIDMIESADGGASTLGAKIDVIDPGCGCSTRRTTMHPCSGGSNVGQISSGAAKVLAGRKVGKLS